MNTPEDARTIKALQDQVAELQQRFADLVELLANDRELDRRERLARQARSENAGDPRTLVPLQNVQNDREAWDEKFDELRKIAKSMPARMVIGRRSR